MWWKRYQQDGEGGLVPRRRRPHHSPNIEVGKQEEQLILKLRKTRNLGARPGLRNRHKPRQYLHPCIHGHICMISDHGVVQSLAEALNQIRPRILSKLSEVLLQAAQICNVFMQEEYDEQVSVVE